eukprot:scaffold54726_cov31-Tisochrysis_lutea.AAC.4
MDGPTPRTGHPSVRPSLMASYDGALVLRVRFRLCSSSLFDLECRMRGIQGVLTFGGTADGRSHLLEASSLINHVGRFRSQQERTNLALGGRCRASAEYLLDRQSAPSVCDIQPSAALNEQTDYLRVHFADSLAEWCAPERTRMVHVGARLDKRCAQPQIPGACSGVQRHRAVAVTKAVWLCACAQQREAAGAVAPDGRVEELLIEWRAPSTPILREQRRCDRGWHRVPLAARRSNKLPRAESRTLSHFAFKREKDCEIPLLPFSSPDPPLPLLSLLSSSPLPSLLPLLLLFPSVT